MGSLPREQVAQAFGEGRDLAPAFPREGCEPTLFVMYLQCLPKFIIVVYFSAKALMIMVNRGYK